MSKNIDVYEKITAQIVAQLQAGVIPWQKTWASSDEAPRNFVSKKPYRGINIFLLGMQGCSSPYWMTYKQAAETAYNAWRKRNDLKESMTARKTYQRLKQADVGEAFDPAKHKGGVRKCEKATPIVFWKILKFEDAQAPRKKSGKMGEKTIPLLRYYNVFNVDQMDGLDLPVIDKPEPDYCHLPEHKRGDANTQRAEQIVKAMPNPPSIKHGGGRAYYSPSEDHVQLPLEETFVTAENYYATAFHELVHSTGHKDRCKRDEIMKIDSFGSETYSREELVAEMGAAMLCGVARIDSKVIDNSAAYIQSWLKRLEDDPKLLVSAAGQAQKAADYILDTKFDNDSKKDSDSNDDQKVMVAA